MKSVCDVLHGQTPNALYPFLWVHGVESEEELRREVQKIRESGIGGFCVEARPHKDFNGPGWFRDLALLLDEAKRTGMEMWILDDSHFPTGFADGQAGAPGAVQKVSLLQNAGLCRPDGEHDRCSQVCPPRPA